MCRARSWSFHRHTRRALHVCVGSRIKRAASKSLRKSPPIDCKGNQRMKWLMEFAEAGQRTDRLADRPNHVELLAAGLMGEAGSVLAELKKEHRERDAYPVYRHRMVEEVGDFLWYFVRLVSVVEPNLLSQLEMPSDASKGPSDHAVPLFLDFGGAVGAVLPLVSTKSAVQ